MQITGIYAALGALLLVFLAARVMRRRTQARIGIGDGGDHELLKRIRVHANAVEYLPISLILLLLVELPARPGRCSCTRSASSCSPAGSCTHSGCRRPRKPASAASAACCFGSSPSSAWPCCCCGGRSPWRRCSDWRRRAAGAASAQAPCMSASLSRKYMPANIFGSMSSLRPCAARASAWPRGADPWTTMSSVSSPPPASTRRRSWRARRRGSVAHAGRGRPGHDELDAAGGTAGFLDQLAVGGGDRVLVARVGLVADQAGRHLDRPAVERRAELLDEQHLVVGGDGDDHDAATGIGAFGVFPAAALHQAQPDAAAKGRGFVHFRRLPELSRAREVCSRQSRKHPGFPR